MKSLGIQKYGKAILRRKSKLVDEFGPDLPDFLDRMVETMIVEEGVGLAAPQVGISKRIAVINPKPDNEETLIRMINPRIVSFSDEKESLEEGCLSVPGIRGSVVRASAVEVVYQDEGGVQRNLKADGLLARIVQHEIDHLDGILFIDRLSIAKKMLIQSKLRSLSDGNGSKK
jgi:peptide deformylase